MNGRHWLSPVFAIGILLSLVACTANLPPAGQARPATSTPARPVPSSTAPATGVALPVAPVGEPVVIASGLDAPWSLLRLPVGGTLISERDTALVRELLADGSLRTVGTVPGVAPAGEGGLLGLAFLGEASGAWVYAYFTAETDNRIVRMPLLGSVDGYSLGAPEVVLEGIPKAGNHDGGRIAFGPDGLLYASVGDAGNPDSAQDRDALGGKILRLGPTGDVPADNPFGTLVYSYGHRNPQGPPLSSLPDDAERGTSKTRNCFHRVE